MITLPRSALRAGRPDYDTVSGLVRQFEQGLPRLHKLARYYEGKHEIAGRTRLPGLPNNRLAHGWPRYIAQVSSAYLLGEPVRVSGPEPATGALRELLGHASADSIDLELAQNQAIFGRAVSLVYEDRAATPHVCSLDPRNAFLVYDDTVAHEPLFGVYLTGNQADRGFSVYTAQEELHYQGNKSSPLTRPHPFGVLPMAEYLNGTDAHGDFEDVISLVDAYNLLQADRMNDRAQFSDALLVLTGVMGIASDEAEGTLERLRQEKTLALPDSEARAEWLVKTPMEQDIEVLRAALARDIHKFSLTPDFTDEQFAGNASGIAIKYKLFNFDNRIKLKERFFVTGLRERARAFCGWLAARRLIELDADALSFRLQRSLPVNELERAQSLAHLQQILPRQTLVFNSPLQSDPSADEHMKTKGRKYEQPRTAPGASTRPTNPNPA